VRTGLFKKLPAIGDADVDRMQANIAAAVDQLAADHDLLSVPATTLTASGAIAPGKSLVVYAGTPGATLTLPLAASQGQNIGAVILIANRSSGAITVRPSGTDTIGGAKSVSLAAAGAIILSSDGIAEWFSAGAGGTNGINGTNGAAGATGATGPASTTVVIGGGLVSGKVFAVDVCAMPKRSGVFTFDLPASIGQSRVGKPVLIQQGPGRDEADPILSMVGQVVSPTKVKVVWQAAAPFRGRAAVNYLIGA